MNIGRKITVAACLFAYIYIGAFYIDKPGLHYDEAGFIPWLIEKNDPFSLGKFRPDGPVSQLTARVGALKSFLFIPIFSILGVSYATIRIPALIIGAFALLLLYLLSKRHLPEPLPLLVLVFCVLDPSMIFHVKTDWGPAAISLLFRMGILLLLSDFVHRQKKRTLYFAAVLAGLGVWNDTGFLIFVIALLFGFYFAFRPSILRHGKAVLGVAAGFVIGAMPLLHFNLNTGWFSLKAIESPFFIFSIDSVLRRLSLALDTLCGVYPFFEYFDGKVGARYTIWPYALVLFGVVSVFIRKKSGRPVFSDKTLLAVALTFAFMMILLLFTSGAETSPFFFYLEGMAQLIFIILVVYVYENTIKEAKVKKAAWALLGIPLVITGAIACAMYNIQLGKKGGENDWTTAIDQVSAFAEHENRKELVALDWGIALPVYVLSSARANMSQLCFKLSLPKTKEEARRELSAKIDQGSALFFTRPDNRLTLKKPMEVFSDIMLQKGRTACIVATFESMTGHTEIYVMETRPEL